MSSFIDDTDDAVPGRHGPFATTEADPREVGPVRTEYSPAHDGDPDPGEIVWTWVPYEENDGRGKDRPVLVVAREPAGTLLAVQLSSKRHDRAAGGAAKPLQWSRGSHRGVPIGRGPWDRSGRDSWVDVDRVLRLYDAGMRREACALDRMRFDLVRRRLRERYGWS
ncbi:MULTISPECIES: type II toxin-antitoxin system PemK/MazF family toxin [Streptomyces]|uniref:type II toxin-antitoxin system PemK/MazF family toxin n=1 Tax=Streptomyces TaxID=1883 RepID=UPI000FC3B0A9|nr:MULTISPECIES: type II toxin-antitoxin system PemK/MazF family toxin [unclassified Streptomyces]MBU8553195.1 type II toxin-antitoxin system PemK/MazF family toxin [Streptomyces sp. Osf17]RSS27467.1 type II toxin-antitoxin system PemK/MazF family toxin [Streptomyces sp. WAC08452]